MITKDQARQIIQRVMHARLGSLDSNGHIPMRGMTRDEIQAYNDIRHEAFFSLDSNKHRNIINLFPPPILAQQPCDMVEHYAYMLEIEYFMIEAFLT